MVKRSLATILSLSMLLALFSSMSLFGTTVSALTTNLVELPDNDGKTDNTSYTIGAGTDAEVEVICDFRSGTQEPTQTITPKYITIHNTGTYVSTATAKNVHNNTNKSSTDMAWHYTVGSEIYQGLQDTRKGWHVGTSYTNRPANGNAIGIEICVDSFPATGTFEGEQWTDGTAIMEWWETKFNDYMKHAAMLTLVLCKRWGLDYKTDVVMHWDAMSYQNGTAGKDCPMQMRATYDEATNTFAAAGSYVDGRDGYFWQMFEHYLDVYAAGGTSVDDTTTAERLGTYKVTPSQGLNVRESASASAAKVGALEMGDIVDVTAFDGNWGKVTLDDGTVGWCNIVDYGEYIGIDAQYYNVGAAAAGLTYSYDADGSLTLVNTSSEQGQFVLNMPLSIGTATTPILSLQMTPLSGNGYYFGLTQKDSGYFMMRDCTLGDELVNATSAPYMTNQETLQIDLRAWWKPTDGQRIDQMCIYVAPNSSVKLNYVYFAVATDTVTDTRYNLMAKKTNVTLMQPDTIQIGDMSKKGRYVYSNGMLTVTADTDAGFDVVFDVNEAFDVNVMKRLLVGIEAYTPYNITLTVTHKDGVGTITLADDFWPGFAEAWPESGYLPAWEGTAGLDLYNYYNYNNVIPEDGMSTVTKVTISLGGAGTSYFNAVQLAENDRILLFRDGQYLEGESTGVAEVLGDLNGDGEASTTDARMIILHTIGSELLTEAQLVLADYDGDGEVSTADARAIILSVIV